MMDKKTLAMVAFPQVLETLAAYADFSASADLAHELQPMTDVALIQQRLELVTEARRLLSVNDSIRLGGCIDMRPYLMIAERGGGLEAKILAQMAYMLTVLRDLGRSLVYHSAEYPRLSKIAEALTPPIGLIEVLNKTVSANGEVLDSASERLGNIRREIHSAYNRMIGRLEKILKDSKILPMLQEPIITQRSGRYVVPLKAEFKGQLRSIVHDQSASGATLFVEPLATVELNNAYYSLQLSERNEIQRILLELSARVGEYAQQLNLITATAAEIDFVLMCAKYADDLHATEPLLVPADRHNACPLIKFYEARHPLLSADKVVPIDVAIPEQTFAVVITGPNTGGKTVSLKTIALMVLMAQSGLHIPVQSGSSFSVYKNVFADIGDEQSIEQSLSTFSGHITNIIRILRMSSRSTLVLLDELGSGTDPQEGAALARAIMAYIAQNRIPCFVASHYPELKTFAHVTDGTLNASMEFNLKTLAPTYRLSIGLPGRSNALLIAERLGLPQSIMDAAKADLDPAELNTESLLDEIHRQHDAARKARSQADRMRSLTENAQRDLQKRLDQIETERQTILEHARTEALQEIDALREEIDNLKRSYRRVQLPLEQIQPLEAQLKKSEQIAKKLQKNATNNTVNQLDKTPLRIGEKVRVRSLHTESLAIISAIEKDEAEIQLGVLRMRVPLADLRRKNAEEDSAEPEPPKIPHREEVTKTAATVFHPSPGVEIDLRGLTSEEAQERLEKYLDDAVLAGLPYVRIIHGKGTGKLRQVSRQMLLDSPFVKYLETGKDNEGGSGVSIAHLKQ